MCDEEIVSVQQLRELEERAFLSGALGCLALVDEAIDVIEKKQGSLSMLRKKLVELSHYMLGEHIADLKDTLKLRAMIYSVDFVTTEKEPETKPEIKPEIESSRVQQSS